MEYIIDGVILDDLLILTREGFNYTILKIIHRNGYDLYEIRINGDESYYKMAKHAIRRD